jgi:phenylpropionate dioxygenase-like ring-hydroxylating dioxygenase large terminal subunit
MGITKSPRFEGNDYQLEVLYGSITITIETKKGGIVSSETSWSASHITHFQITQGSEVILDTTKIHKDVEVVFPVSDDYINFTVDNNGIHHFPTFDSLKNSSGVKMLKGYLN